MKVFVIEDGEYEQRGVVAVAVSFEAGCRAIKAIYGTPPRKVRWREDPENGVLFADFYEHVPGHHCKYQTTFDFTEYEVEQ